MVWWKDHAAQRAAHIGSHDAEHRSCDQTQRVLTRHDKPRYKADDETKHDHQKNVPNEVHDDHSFGVLTCERKAECIPGVSPLDHISVNTIRDSTC